MNTQIEISKGIYIRERSFTTIQTMFSHKLKLLNMMKIDLPTLDLLMPLQRKMVVISSQRIKSYNKIECPYDTIKGVCKVESQNDQKENLCHTSEVEINIEDEKTAEINVDIEEENMTRVITRN